MFNKLKIISKNSKFFRQVSILAGGTALGQLVSIAVSPALTRLYTPQSFGILAVYTSIITIISIAASLRYELAIPITKKDEDVVNLITLSFSILIITTLLFSGFLWFTGAKITLSLNISQINPYLWLFPIGMLATGIYQIFNYVAIRLQIFTTLARTKLYQGISQAVVQLFWGIIFGSNPVGLIFGQVISQSAGTSTLVHKSRSVLQELRKQITIQSLLITANRHRRFPIFSASSALINNAGLQLPSIILMSLYGPQVAGLYALGERLTRLPLNLIGQSISQVYLSEASRKANEDVSFLHHLFLKTSKNLLFACVPLGLLFLVTTPLYPVVFGRSWSEAGIYVLVLTPMVLARFVVTPLSQTLNILERQDLQLVWDVARLMGTFVSLFIPHYFGWQPLYAILTYSVVMLIAYFTLYWLTVFVMNRKLSS